MPPPEQSDKIPPSGEATADEAPTNGPKKVNSRTTLIGAIFLMATSAIGPGFITQTTLFAPGAWFQA